MTFRDSIQLLRVHQYLKNLFIFLPLFFSLRVYEARLLLDAFLAFVIFSIIASAVYILNDYHDIQEDRAHPVKKHRPLAAGRISGPTALWLMAALLTSGLAAAWGLTREMFLLCALYILLDKCQDIVNPGLRVKSVMTSFTQTRYSQVSGGIRYSKASTNSSPR